MKRHPDKPLPSHNYAARTVQNGLQWCVAQDSVIRKNERMEAGPYPIQLLQRGAYCGYRWSYRYWFRAGEGGHCPGAAAISLIDIADCTKAVKVLVNEAADGVSAVFRAKVAAFKADVSNFDEVSSLQMLETVSNTPKFYSCIYEA